MYRCAGTSSLKPHGLSGASRSPALRSITCSGLSASSGSTAGSGAAARPVHPRALLPRHAEAIVERAPPRARGDPLQSLDIGGGERLAAFVAARDEVEVVVERREFGVACRAQASPASPPSARPFQYAISASRFSTSKRMRISWMRSQSVSSLVALSTTYSGVVTLPQSCSQLAMCTASHSSSSSAKSRNGPVARVARRLRQQLGELGHALAVTAGVGRLGVDRRRDELDECFEQCLLLGDETPRLDRDRGDARQVLHEREHLRRQRIGAHRAAHQRQHAVDVAGTVTQRNRDKTDVFATDGIGLGSQPRASWRCRWL